MFDRLVIFIEKHKLVNDLQFGFRKDKSTYMALMEAVDIVTNALDRGETVLYHLILVKYLIRWTIWY